MITNVLICWAILIILTCLAIRERRKSVGKLYWHIHHDKLLEMATEPIARRIKYIREQKAVEEIGARLRYLKPVKGTLPGEVIEAFWFHDAVMKHRDRIWKFHWSMGIDHHTRVTHKLSEELCRSRDKADADLRVTLQKYELEINRLHDAECRCSWNGTTLFPESSRYAIST